MKKIIIHIGTPKAGSTSLQNFFNHYNFVNCAVNYPKTDYIKNRNGSFLLLPQSSEIFKESIEIIKRELENNNLIILSDEILSFHFVYNDVPFFKDKYIKPANIADNFKYFIDLFPNIDVEFLVYLRRQDNYIESEFKETLRDFGYKSKNRNNSFSELFKEYIATKSEMLNYYNWISQLISVVGEDRLTIKSFDNCSRIGLVKDFVKTYGINVSDEIINQYDVIANKGFSFTYLYVFNMLINNSSRELFWDSIFKYGYLDIYQNYHLLNEKETKELMDKYVDINHRVEQLICYKQKELNMFNYDYKNHSLVFNQNSDEINELQIKLIIELAKNELRQKTEQPKKSLWQRIKNKIKSILRINRV